MASSSTTPLEPITRSRTLLFLSYRDSSVRTPRNRHRPSRSSYSTAEPDVDEHEGLLRSEIGNADHITIEMGSDLLPRWVDISDQVEDILTGTQAKIAVLDKLHAKHVLPGFTDRSAEEREIESMSTDITRDFRQCQTLIQRIAPTPQHKFPPTAGGTSKNESQAAKNVQRGLAAKVQELSGAFRKKQRVYMQKLQGHASKHQDILIASGAISLRGSDGITALEEDVQATRDHQLTTQQQLDNPDLDLDTRTREVNEIAKSISSLAELFKDLSSLVIDQGTILDSIEYNVEQTAVHVQEAVKELNIATRYQKNTGRRQCIFLLFIIIIGLIFVLIFKPRRSSTEPPSRFV